MHLIVGLGNPGEKYEHTRHNVGFDVLAILSEKLHIPITRLKGDALIGEGFVSGEKVVLCKPQTFMNLSGEAVRQLMNWYKLEPEQLMVIYDDIDLAPGWLRIRASGSAGTHNGMRNIVECIGTEAFPRIRVGIGGKPPVFDLVDWVLSRYQTPEARQTAYDAYVKAADAAATWVRSGVETAMNRYNTKKPKPPRPEKAQAAEGEAVKAGEKPAGAEPASGMPPKAAGGPQAGADPPPAATDNVPPSPPAGDNA
jgi:PTH1 family peptidyl-tRNA hydrolase